MTAGNTLAGMGLPFSGALCISTPCWTQTVAGLTGNGPGWPIYGLLIAGFLLVVAVHLLVWRFFLLRMRPLRVLNEQLRARVEDLEGLAEARAEELSNVRTKLEAALQATEERYKGVFNALSEGVLLCDANLRILECNTALVRLFGIPPEQLIRCSVDTLFQDARAEDGTPLEHSAYPCARTFAEGQGITDWVVAVIDPAGQWRWLLVNTQPLTPPGEEAPNVVVMSLFDITERRNTEQNQRTLEHQMQHARKLESLGVLAGGIAHDFNNLLMGILGNAELLLEDLPEDAGTRCMVEDIHTTTMRASRLARQMLAYTGRGPISLELLSLNSALEELIPLFQATIPRGTELELRFASGLSPIEADPEQLRQIVQALVVNAVEALQDGAGTIRVATGQMPYDAEMLAGLQARQKPAPGEFVWLEVCDTGSGMDRDVLERVFDPFFTTKFTGRGMGLAALLGIVESHGGAVHVESAPGEGSAFRVLFPVAPEDKEYRPEPARPEPQKLVEDKLVLLVDDEAAVRSVGAEILRRAGWQVATARDGVEALQVYDQEPASIACVVLDLSMPRTSGEKTLHELRTRSADLPILVSSGFDEALLHERLNGWPVAGFIHKPYQRGELLSKVQAATGQAVQGPPEEMREPGNAEQDTRG